MKAQYDDETSELYNTLYDNIKTARPNISTSSLSSYVSNIKRIRSKIYDEQSFSDFSWLVDWEYNIKRLEDIYPNIHTFKTNVASIIVAGKAMGLKNDEAFEKYDTLVKEGNKKYGEVRGKKTKRQEDKWQDWEEIVRVVKHKLKAVKDDGLFEKENLTSVQWKKLRELVAVALYTLSENNPPVRSDYGNMKIITDVKFNKLPEGEQDKNNWLVVKGPNKKTFVFSNTKTSKKMGDVVVKVSPELNKLIKVWLSKNKESEYLFPNKQHNPISGMAPASFGKMIVRFFEKHMDKKIGITMLRTIFISHKFPNVNDERSSIAEKMGHSVKQQINYSKE